MKRTDLTWFEYAVLFAVSVIVLLTVCGWLFPAR